ncbi:MAG: PepSY domain-containing protein [Acidobacteria bacterium]|nr:PepSY domain-containing protein [Acidobacteriota bacterium]
MKRLIAPLIVVHRYVGLALCLVFLIWFSSGLVMVYKRMPELTAEERLERLPALDPAAIRLTPAAAFDAAGVTGAPQRVLLTSVQGRPAYRFAFDAGSLTVFADDGSYLENVAPDDSVSIAAGLFPDSRSTVRYLDARTGPDQWTITNRFSTTGALHRVALGDAAGTEVYVAEATGEIVMKTDRASRFWGYAGPVMHWFYFTPLRVGQAPLWNTLIVYGSVAGCVLCLLGLVIGVYRFSLSRRFLRGTSATPYAGWLRWHHYAGLAFGVIAFTWTLSGLLTMTPWNLFPPAGPSRAQVSAIRGGAVALDRFTVTPAAAIGAFRTQFEPKELELLQFMGEPYYAAYQRDVSVRPHQDTARYAPGDERPARVLVSAGGGAPQIRAPFTRDDLLAAARAAMGGVDPVDVAWLTRFDAYYYDRTGGRRLPALRAKFDDADQTWLYLDSSDGSLVLAEVRGSRAERWLYQGLHSLDFPRLYQTSWAWYPLIVGLSLGGIALSLTSLIVAWTFLRGKVRPAVEPARVSVRQSA